MRSLLISSFVLSLLLIGSTANAATVNYETGSPFFKDSRLNFQIGDSGAYSTSNGQTFNLSHPLIGSAHSFGATLNATIPAQSQIVFSYTTSDPMTTLGANIGGLITGTPGFAFANTNLTSPLLTISIPDPSGLLVVMASFIDSTHAKIVFQNFSTAVASITQALAAGVSTFVTGSYSVSPVPLPAALPLMGAGLLGLWGVGRKNRRKAA